MSRESKEKQEEIDEALPKGEESKKERKLDNEFQ